MCGPNAAKIYKQPFRAAKDHVQPFVALDSFLPNGKKNILAVYHPCPWLQV